MKNARRVAAAGRKTTQAAADHQFADTQLYFVEHYLRDWTLKILTVLGNLFKTYLTHYRRS